MLVASTLLAGAAITPFAMTAGAQVAPDTTTTTAVALAGGDPSVIPDPNWGHSLHKPPPVGIPAVAIPEVVSSTPQPVPCKNGAHMDYVIGTPLPDNPEVAAQDYFAQWPGQLNPHSIELLAANPLSRQYRARYTFTYPPGADRQGSMELVSYYYAGNTSTGWAITDFTACEVTA